MLSSKSLTFLEKLLLCSGPSGFEEETAGVFRNELSGFSERCYTDVTGNTIGVLNPDASLKIMLAGHYDEIGFQVVYISEDGLVHFRNVGGVDRLTVPGLEVEIITTSGHIHGVIGKKPIHLEQAKERDQVIELANMWIDIGAESKKEAQKHVTIGDAVAVKPNFRFLGKHRILSKGLDDKIGAFVVVEVLRELSRRKLNVAVYAVGTVQEELGLRGVITSSYGINPQVGFAVDVGFATDVPNIEKKMYGDISLGKGAVLSRNADNNPVLGRKLRAIAKKFKIDIQEDAGLRASGGTDTAHMQLSHDGVATGLISIPNRYMHTPVEMCDLRDVEGAIRLLTETIASLHPGDTYIPGVD